MSELRIEDLVVRYGHGAGAHTAVDHVSLVVPHGEIVGLVGESGSGKSTIARAAVGLAPIAGGRILLDGRMSIGDTIAESLPRGLRRAERAGEIARLLELVHLDPGRAAARPGELS